jgi:hypothetical protein
LTAWPGALLGKRLGLEFLRPFREGFPDGGRLPMADLVSLVGSKIPHLVFDAIQLPNLGDKPKRFDEAFLQCLVKASASMG